MKKSKEAGPDQETMVTPSAVWRNSPQQQSTKNRLEFKACLVLFFLKPLINVVFIGAEQNCGERLMVPPFHHTHKTEKLIVLHLDEVLFQVKLKSVLNVVTNFQLWLTSYREAHRVRTTLT